VSGFPRTRKTMDNRRQISIHFFRLALCRPYGTRFHFSRLTQGFRPGLLYAAPTGLAFADAFCLFARSAPSLQRQKRVPHRAFGAIRSDKWVKCKWGDGRIFRFRIPIREGKLEFLPSLRDSIPFFEAYPRASALGYCMPPLRGWRLLMRSVSSPEAHRRCNDKSGFAFANRPAPLRMTEIASLLLRP
jgi:hypothetical protein